jgi:hypothetical protein
VRLSLVSMDGQALPITVNELTVTKSAAGGEIRD